MRVVDIQVALGLKGLRGKELVAVVCMNRRFGGSEEFIGIRDISRSVGRSWSINWSYIVMLLPAQACLAEDAKCCGRELDNCGWQEA